MSETDWLVVDAAITVDLKVRDFLVDELSDLLRMSADEKSEFINGLIEKLRNQGLLAHQ